MRETISFGFDVRKSIARSRDQEVERESNALICIIIGTTFLLSLRPLSALQPCIYALIFVLDLLFLLVNSGGKSPSPGISSRAWFAYSLWFAFISLSWASDSFQSTTRVVQTVVLGITLLVFSRYSWNQDRLNKLGKAMLAWQAIMLAHWVITSRAFDDYSGFSSNSNEFAGIVIFSIVVGCLVFATGDAKLGTSIYIIGLLLVMISGSRSALLAGLIIPTASYAFIRFKSTHGRRGLARFLFIAALSLALAFTFIYPMLYGTSLGTELNLLSREIFGKNFFSGREILWRSALQSLQGNELFGLSPSFRLEAGLVSGFSTQLSTHNLYLQVLLQSGVVGLVLLILFLSLFYMDYTKENSNAAAVGIALMLGIIAHECFEVSLTQNNFQVGILMWMALAIAWSASRNAGVSRQKIESGEIHDRLSRHVQRYEAVLTN